MYTGYDRDKDDSNSAVVREGSWTWIFWLFVVAMVLAGLAFGLR